MLDFLYSQFMGKRELSPHQRAVLQWIADGCPETDWGGRAYKNSARMLAGYDLVKVRGHGDGWSATVTARGSRVLNGDEPLVHQGKKKAHDSGNDSASPKPKAAKPAPAPVSAPPPRYDVTQQAREQAEQLYQRLIQAEFNIVTGLPLDDETTTDWSYVADRLRSLPVVQEQGWRVSTRTHQPSYWRRNDIKTLDVALIPRDEWLTTKPEANASKDRIGRYHPAVATVMEYSTNISASLKPRARRLLHSLFSEADARGFTHGSFTISAYGSYQTARERGSLGTHSTGYGFNDGFKDHFVAASEQVDRVERPPTKDELRWHESELRWHPNAKLKTFYDHPYNGKILITIEGRQVKDTKRKTAEQRLPEIFATMSLELAWKQYDREMKRRADGLWQKKLAIAEVRADEWIKNQSFHDSLRERSNAWDQYKRIEGYVEELRRHLASQEIPGASTEKWLSWCESHMQEQHPMSEAGLPDITHPSSAEKSRISDEIARNISDQELSEVSDK